MIIVIQQSGFVDRTIYQSFFIVANASSRQFFRVTTNFHPIWLKMRDWKSGLNDFHRPQNFFEMLSYHQILFCRHHYDHICPWKQTAWSCDAPITFYRSKREPKVIFWFSYPIWAVFIENASKRGCQRRASWSLSRCKKFSRGFPML